MLLGSLGVDTVNLMDIDVVERPIVVTNTAGSVRFARLRMLLALHFLDGVDYNNFIIFFIRIEVFRRLLSLNSPWLLLRPIIVLALGFT